MSECEHYYKLHPGCPSCEEERSWVSVAERSNDTASVTIPAKGWHGQWPEYEANGLVYVPATRKTKGDVMTFYYRKPNNPNDRMRDGGQRQ